MARIARLVVPGLPHHVTQRGNGRQQVFFEEEDYALYQDLIFDAAAQCGSRIWCWCLMPNHVHIILVPRDEDGLRRTFADAHRRYTGFINARRRKTGHLWQGRFGSVVVDEDHLYHAVRYVSLNPVRAGLVRRAKDWKWSSVRAHLAARDDRSFTAQPVLDRFGNFSQYLAQGGDDAQDFAGLRLGETTGRPLGSVKWIAKLERKTGRILMPHKRGPKLKET
ncbi:MAG: transposase [Beijerinckiaceae bacterium]|jgi:putative transposase|nr:transposase [Beijerinckiaceae bacterium]